jgi:predicted nucleotidyltransferase
VKPKAEAHGFDTSLLDRYLAARRRSWERERKAALACARQTLLEARQRYGIREAYILGSVLDPRRWGPSSDVDVAVSGGSGRILELMAELEESCRREVDVIDLDRHPAAAWLRQKGWDVYATTGSARHPQS